MAAPVDRAHYGRMAENSKRFRENNIFPLNHFGFPDARRYVEQSNAKKKSQAEPEVEDQAEIVDQTEIYKSNPAALTAHSKVPKYIFETFYEYSSCYRAGSEWEMDRERESVDRFNNARTIFGAWPLCKLPQTSLDTQSWIIVIDCKQKMPAAFPEMGAKCSMAMFDACGLKQLSRNWSAVRVHHEHPGLTNEPTFKITMNAKIAVESIIKPIVDMNNPSGEDVVLNEWNNIYVMMSLDYCDSTATSELGALDEMTNIMESRDPQYRETQAMFKYIVTLKEPAHFVNLFDCFPHMKDALDGNLDNLSPQMRKRAEALNRVQRRTYENLLSKLPCGIGIIPGGPGGGKTFFNLYITAMAQSKPIKYEEKGVIKERNVKILYMLDINQPIDDTINKLVKMSEELGDNKVIIRMFGWAREWKNGLRMFKDQVMAQQLSSGAGSPNAKGKMNATPDGDLVSIFIQMSLHSQETSKESRLAPTLDQFAFRHFLAHKDKYSELSRLLKEYLDGDCKTLSPLRVATFSLYNDALAEADFVAATPVAAASNLAGGKFKPDLVLFDEAPHARELSNIIAVAHFQPKAWIFTGDHRQTGCYLGSNKKNPWRTQMRMSIMERADRVGAVDHDLVMNHRAFGDLVKMPSELFYDAKMFSGHSAEQMLPPPAAYIRDWLYQLTPGTDPLEVSRLIVHVCNCKPPVRVGTSFYNQSHEDYVMFTINRLMDDPRFRSVDGKAPGSILVISPYKESFLRYRAKVGLLLEAKRRSGQAAATINKVEARTVDTVQGHEADMVIFDVVRETTTPFLDDRKRLAVATTRARQGEMYMVHPSLYERMAAAPNLEAVYRSCEDKVHGQVAWVDPEAMGVKPMF